MDYMPKNKNLYETLTDAKTGATKLQPIGGKGRKGAVRKARRTRLLGAEGVAKQDRRRFKKATSGGDTDKKLTADTIKRVSEYKTAAKKIRK